MNSDRPNPLICVVGSSYLQQLFQWSAGLSGPSFNWNPYLNPTMQMTAGSSLDLGFPSIAQPPLPAAATVAAAAASSKSDKTLTPSIKPLKTPQPPATPAATPTAAAAAIVPSSTPVSKREPSPAGVAVVDEQPLDLSRKPAKASDVSSASSSLLSKQLKPDRAKPRDSVVAPSKALDLAPICRS